ncbi:hypothetical protein CTH_0066 [Carboxydocella thermautotrophica]|nr:hypothetical protein CTH_0066 [Carboxydocella thermautotrophica]
MAMQDLAKYQVLIEPLWDGNNSVIIENVCWGLGLNRTIVGWKPPAARDALSGAAICLNRTIVGWKHWCGKDGKWQDVCLNRTIVGWKPSLSMPNLRIRSGLNRTIVGWKLMVARKEE